MCTNPGRLPNGQTFACRKCPQCRDAYVDDWVGRCIAESKTSVAVTVITLTYGNERWMDGRDIDPDQRKQAAMLCYPDVQRYFKRLRNDGFEFKYLCVGEYGTLKGRAHWHLVIFWRDKVPEHKVREDFHERHWPHGWSYWDDKADVHSFRYVCKYLSKDLEADAAKQGKLTMSKTPPLGADYFELLAQRYVDDQLAPQSEHYWFAEVRRKSTGLPRQFRLTRASARHFLSAYVRRWQLCYGKRYLPASPFLEDYLDRLNKRDPLYLKSYRAVPPKPWFVPDWWYRSPKHEPWFDDARNCWYVEKVSGERLYWSFDDEGRRAWLDVIRTEPAEVREVSKSRVSGYNEYSGRKDGTFYETRRTRH